MEVVLQKMKPMEARVPLLIIGLTEEVKDDPSEMRLTGPLGDMAERVIRLGDFKGARGEATLVYTTGEGDSERVMYVGFGKKTELTAERVRETLGEAARRARDLGVEEVGISLTHLQRGGLSPNDAAEAAVESFIMGGFQDTYHKTQGLDKFRQVKELHLLSPYSDDRLENGAYQGKVLGEAVNMCRRLSWGPANHVTPGRLAEEAMGLRELGVKVEVLERADAERLGLKSFLAVARGTSEPPKFITMEYGDTAKDTVALIGKAITFDTGGISLKEREGMELMKTDMTGGAIVISVVRAAAQLKLPLHLVGLVPATDNMPSGTAYHPGDVVDTYAGLTVEVISTDAEGRMILNDALAYAAKNYKPKAMFDFATLTGAMGVALGEHAIGYFANDDAVAKRIEAASHTSGEAVWRMPLWDVYDEQLKSDVADWKHTGGRPGGAITAARFLSKFVGGTPWAHFDIAGLMEQKADKGYNPKGSKGPAVRLILDVLRNW
jgi:leucyl aminopeptidase